eukprot:gnl/TRDRNA2_/TRDRNA2_86157_c0_seq1.p1 gnl/TRDRNA2_/TRDRNA2_86157_c0~~gnl/TRDRNA2_/TRDRNA2_86157_c0_seq1.p1  ORF type:complete len:373 (+),score=62.96 gnl/TRDRNA2_/TRDRNA2_86157_c0_seq1:57-1121(+)
MPGPPRQAIPVRPSRPANAPSVSTAGLPVNGQAGAVRVDGRHYSDRRPRVSPVQPSALRLEEGLTRALEQIALEREELDGDVVFLEDRAEFVQEQRSLVCSRLQQELDGKAARLLMLQSQMTPSIERLLDDGGKAAALEKQIAIREEQQAALRQQCADLSSLIDQRQRLCAEEANIVRMAQLEALIGPRSLSSDDGAAEPAQATTTREGRTAAETDEESAVRIYKAYMEGYLRYSQAQQPVDSASNPHSAGGGPLRAPKRLQRPLNGSAANDDVGPTGSASSPPRRPRHSRDSVEVRQSPAQKPSAGFGTGAVKANQSLHRSPGRGTTKPAESDDVPSIPEKEQERSEKGCLTQ